MLSEERGRFLPWYKIWGENYTLNFQEELIKYCRQDVNILRMAFLRFMQQFQIETKVNPLLEAISIASACNLVYRRN